MGPKGFILVNPRITTFQQSLTHSALYPTPRILLSDLAVAIRIESMSN